MRRHTNHILSVAEWAAFFRLDLYRVAGFCCTDSPSESNCHCNNADPFTEFEQPDQAGRDSISWAIAEAEYDLLNYLHFPVAPLPFEGIRVDYDQPKHGAPFTWFKPRGGYKSVRLPYGYVEKFGIQTFSAPLAGVVVTPPSFPLVMGADLFTVTVTVPVNTSADEITLWIAAADRLGESYEHWQIEPLHSISIDPDTWVATIKIKAYHMGQPALTHSDTCVDRDEESSYVETVEIRLKTWDVCQQGIAIASGGDCDNPPCAETSVDVCFDLADESSKPHLGIVVPKPASCNDDSVYEWAECSSLIPTKIEANFTAGYPLVDGKMHPLMLAAVAYLAASKLACAIPICRCSRDNCQYKSLNNLRFPPKEKTTDGKDSADGDYWTLLFNKNEEPPFGSWAAGSIKAFGKVKRLAIKV